jgi:hypothetical protein
VRFSLLLVFGLHCFNRRRDSSAGKSTRWESGLRDRVAAGLGRLECGCVPWQQDKVAERPLKEASRQK